VNPQTTAESLEEAVRRGFGDRESVLVQVLLEALRVLQKTDERSIPRLVEATRQARHVFVAGKGSSGLVARCFAMRLMHMGLASYVLDETITPATHRDDLLVVFSASGETEEACSAAEKGRKLGAKVGPVTTNPESRLGKSATMNIVLPAHSKRSPRRDDRPAQYAGSAFEQSALLFSDAVVLEAMRKWNMTPQELATRHANLD
jgi:6-phospho-3-hexuloisomerase